MFVKNDAHLQQELFGIENQLSETKRKKLQRSKEAAFYNLIFANIDEHIFAPIYSTTGSRPNAPINALVASIILQNHNGWTCEELFNRIDFDLLTRTALGLNTFDETPFCPATFFNFQNRLSSYYGETGINLFEFVFDRLTSEQLKKLKMKTNIQRMDSFQALSNIRSYSRVQLLIEVLLRLHRVLDDSDKQRCAELLNPYCTKTSSKFVYDLKRSDIPHELQKLADVYHRLYQQLNETYGRVEAFHIFERVYTEHFTVVSETIQVKDSKDVSSGSLQSPDDIDATFRQKHGEKNRGQVINISETAHPENELNLLNDIAVESNNTDDSTILNKRIEPIKEKTPELEELHTDGAYGSSDNDEKMEEAEVTHVQTAVRGRTAAVSMVIDKNDNDDEEYVVSCPHQTVTAQKGNKRFKACFDNTICQTCQQCNDCPAIEQKSGVRVYYFDEDTARQNKRIRNIDSIPVERKGLRPNVEATVKEFSKGFNHKGKLRVRGKFRTMIFAFTMGIGINFGRIYRYVMENAVNGDFRTALAQFFAHVKGLLERLLGFSMQSVQIFKSRKRKMLLCQVLPKPTF